MMRILTVFVILLALGAGIIILQIYLSKQESKWAGLILPIVSFGLTVFVALGAYLFSFNALTETLTVNGEIVERTITQINNESAIIMAAVYTFLLFNIPTAILLAVYAACRGKRNKRQALDRMSAQDLG